ncbi:MAG: hypothetical protein HUU07_06685 [Candidatus Brocadia sinica]|nr:hypothetical protein [Candidatus Brocadia sinica]
MEDTKLPVYEAPEVITYTDEEIFEKLGPAHTGTLGADVSPPLTPTARLWQ